MRQIAGSGSAPLATMGTAAFGCSRGCIKCNSASCGHTGWRGHVDRAADDDHAGAGIARSLGHRVTRGARGYRSRMFGREAMYRRSLALRAAVADGWDDERIARALASVDEAQMALF